MIKHKAKAHYLTCSIIFCSLFFSTSISLAGIYKWIDDQGETHYGSQPPKNTSRQKMEVQQYAPRDTSSYKKPGVEKEDDAEKTDEPAQEEKIKQQPKEAVETKADKKRRKTACKNARSNLSKMQASGRIRQRDKDGNVSYLSQKQKEENMKKLRKSAAKHCK